MQHPPSTDELDAAQVLSLKPEQVEGVQAGRGLTVVAEQPVEVRQALRQCATASPSSMIRLKGSARIAAVMATNSADQSRPFRDHRRTLLAVLMGDDAIAVVPELVQPAIPRRHLMGEDRPVGLDVEEHERAVVGATGEIKAGDRHWAAPRRQRDVAGDALAGIA